MTATDLPESARQPSAPRAHDTSTFGARMKAAGLDTFDPEAVDKDTFRRTLARIITMYTNEWHGCPELLCKRNRGCMAPHIHCSNVPQLSPEEAEKEWWKVRDDIVVALHEGIAERLAADGVSEDDL
jgi:hypothetical protein